MSLGTMLQLASRLFSVPQLFQQACSSTLFLRLFSLITTASLLIIVRKYHCNSKAAVHFKHSPRQKFLPFLSRDEKQSLPYPPNFLPGGRDVATPYGSTRVYEWGPENGERVLLVHGVSTPCIALADLAMELVERGFRVMLFDLFGRGYSDAPNPRRTPYDAHLYITHMLHVLASSGLSWERFHLFGYSLGGCLVVAFAAQMPHRVASLTLIAGAGLIRPHHLDGWSRMLFRGIELWGGTRRVVLPECLVEWFVRKSVKPAAASRRNTTTNNTASRDPKTTDGTLRYSLHTLLTQYLNPPGDVNGGTDFNMTPISPSRLAQVTTGDVISWQIDYHEGFVGAFTNTMQHCPIYAPQGEADWKALGRMLRERRKAKLILSQDIGNEGGSRGGAEIEGFIDDEKRRGVLGTDGTGEGLGKYYDKILFVLGSHDTIIVPDETLEDAKRLLGEQAVESVVLGAGHELGISRGAEIADIFERFLCNG